MKGQKESSKLKVELDRLKRIQEEQRGRILYEMEKQKNARRAARAAARIEKVHFLIFKILESVKV